MLNSLPRAARYPAGPSQSPLAEGIHGAGALCVSARSWSPETYWRTERCFWALGVMFLVAATVGVFGSGIQARTVRSSGDAVSLAITYQRVTRLR